MAILSACASGMEAKGGWAGVADGGTTIFVVTPDRQVLSFNSADDIQQPYAFPQEPDKDILGAVYGTPMVTDSFLYVADFNGRIYSLDRHSLEIVGSFEIEGDELSKGIANSMAISGNRVVLGSSEDSETGRIYVLDSQNIGDEICRFPSSGEPPIGKIWGAPHIANNIAYFGSLDHNLYAISIEDCSSLWNTPVHLGGALASTPIIIENTLFIGSFDRHLYSVNITTGESTRLFKAGSWFWSGLATDGTRLYVPNMDGKLYAVDLDTNRQLWAFDTGGPILSTPVIIDGTVVVASDSRKLYLLNSQDGSQIWNIDVKVKVRAPLMAQGSTVYISSDDNDKAVIAVDIDKKRTWTIWPKSND